MVNLLAGKLKRMYKGSDYSDLVQQAWLFYFEAELSYSVNKGTKKSTWLFTQIQGRLKDYCKRSYKKSKDYYNNDLDQAINYTYELKAPILSNQAKFVLDLIDNGKMSNPRVKIGYSTIKRGLQNLGWELSQINLVYSELKSAWSMA